MTTEELTAAVDLDVRLRSKAGTWTLEVRTVDLEAQAEDDPGKPGSGAGKAARTLLASASAEVEALGPIAARGILMAAGVRRLARLKTAVTVLSGLAPAGNPTK